MNTLRPLSLAAALATAGCVVVPVTVEGFDPDCRVVTRHMELQSVQVNALGRCGDGACAALVLGVGAASAIVSGSIVVVGNIAYWAEHRANCIAPAPAPPVAAN
jgi:hypothetical protein